ncbi:MAG: hypothetical protein P3C09_13385 [Gemmatimonadota bacterium]|nr:hypothetical protein [Gemmatimonadota bacterium]MDQ8168743.1 hypothetical protein [Gemmatimonadota bacterium]
MSRRLLMSRLLVASVLFSACASGGSTSGSVAGSRPATETVRLGRLGSLTMSNTPTADVSRIPSSVDAVWRIMPSVFDSLGVPVATIDPAGRVIGNPGYKTRQRLGKAPLSRYLDCGNTQIGPNADSYDVFLTVLTTVRADAAGADAAGADAAGAAGASLSTIVEARARPVTYNQAYSNCSSKGGIERRITELVNARLAR